MSGRKKKKKSAKFSKLKAGLSAVYNLYVSNRKKQISDRVIKKVNANLASLDKNNFKAVGVSIVAYRELLSNNPDRYKKQLSQLDSKLEKLSPGKSICGFKAMWERQFIALLSKGEAFTHSFEEGCIYHYCFHYYLNQLLQKQLIPDSDVIRALRVFNLSYVEEQYLPRLFRATLLLPTQQILSQILGYYIGMREEGKHALGVIMQGALKVGQCDVVSYLLQKEINLPKSVDKVILTLMTAIITGETRLIDRIFCRFSVENILKTAEQHHLFQVSRYCIMSGRIKVGAVADEMMGRMIELAAVRYDREFLKKIFQALSEEKRVLFYRNHVWAYVPSHSLESNEEDTQAVNMIRYYMEKGLFTFSLEEEEGDLRLFGPRSCGMLQQWLAYLKKEEFAYCSGIFREEVTITPCTLSRGGSFHQRSSRLFQENGIARNDFFYGVDVTGREVPIFYQGAKERYLLTTYYRSEAELTLLFVHTPPRHFNSLSRVISKLYKEICDKGFPLLGAMWERFISREEQVAMLENIARLIWLKQHEHIYYQASEETSSIIFRALFLYFGLGFCETPKTAFLNAKILNKLALSCSSIENFVEKFPTCFGKAQSDYVGCLEKLASIETDNMETNIPALGLMKEGELKTDIFRCWFKGKSGAPQPLKGKEEESAIEFNMS